jgi:hypothetical protein
MVGGSPFPACDLPQAWAATQNNLGIALRALGLDECFIDLRGFEVPRPFPRGLVEFHSLIDALDCPALGYHPATVRATARTVTLTTANDVLLDAVQRGPKILGSVSITSWIEEHGGTYRGFVQVFPAISRRASGQSELFGIGQNAILKELHFCS